MAKVIAIPPGDDYGLQCNTRGCLTLATWFDGICDELLCDVHKTLHVDAHGMEKVIEPAPEPPTPPDCTDEAPCPDTGPFCNECIRVFEGV